MRKLFALLIAAVMVLSFAACAAPAADEPAHCQPRRRPRPKRPFLRQSPWN